MNNWRCRKVSVCTVIVPRRTRVVILFVNMGARTYNIPSSQSAPVLVMHTIVRSSAFMLYADFAHTKSGPGLIMSQSGSTSSVINHSDRVI